MANAASTVLRDMLESDRVRSLHEVEYSFPYVYVILQDGHCQYVGFTTSPLARICDHMSQGRASTYDQFRFLLMPSSEAGVIVERALIKLFAPPLNSAFMNHTVSPDHWSLMLGAVGLDPTDVSLLEAIEESTERLGLAFLEPEKEAA